MACWTTHDERNSFLFKVLRATKTHSEQKKKHDSYNTKGFTMPTLKAKQTRLYSPLQLALFGMSLTSAQASAQLEEVIVTAEFREKSAMDTAISITAFNKDLMNKFRMEDSGDIANQTPNVQIGESFGQASPRIAIRGIVNADFGTQASTPVTIYSDGVVLNNPAIQSFAMYDLERVEVLRGPQGTLYGRNATAGSINFISAKPTDELTGYGLFTVARFGQQRFEGAVSGPITDSVKGRLSINHGVSDGWVENVLSGEDGPEQDDLSIRGFLDFSLSDNVSVLLKAQYSEYDGNAGLFPTIAPVSAFTGQPNPGPANNFRDIALNQFDTEEVIESDDYMLQVNWDLGEMSLVSITGYNEHDRVDFNDADGQEFTLLHWQYAHQSEQFSQEFRLSSNTDGPLSWMAGVYYLDETVEAQTRFELFTFAPPPTVTVGQGYDGDQDLTSYAGFIQLDYTLNENWLVGLGLRYTDDEKEIDYSGSNCYLFAKEDDRSFLNPNVVSPECPPVLGGTSAGDLSDSESWSAVSGALSVQYRPNDRTMVYGNVSNGFKGGAFNLSTADVRTVSAVDPEDLWAYEVGIKWGSEARDVVISASSFFYDYRDLHQFTFVDLNEGVGTPNLASFLENIEKAEIMGAELEMMFAPTESALINLGFSWTDAEFKNFESFGGNLDGNQLPASPEFTFNGVAQYEFSLSEDWSIIPQLDWSWIDESFADTLNSETAVVASQNPSVPDQLVNVKIPANWDVNFRLTLVSERMGLSVTAFIEDIGEDEGDINHHFLGGVQAAFGSTFAKLSQPETYGLTVQYEF